MAREQLQAQDSQVQQKTGADNGAAVNQAVDGARDGQMTQEWQSPAESCLITSPFGPRNISGNRGGGSSNHKGIDMRAYQGKAIVAAADGKAVVTGGDYNTIDIVHSQTLTTRYLHASAIKVANGKEVKKGDTIALSGGKGPNGPNQYDAHLHFEVHDNGTRIDPEAFLINHGVSLSRKSGLPARKDAADPASATPAKTLSSTKESAAIKWYVSKGFSADLIKRIQVVVGTADTGTMDATAVQAVGAWQKLHGFTGKLLDGEFGGGSAAKSGDAQLEADIRALLEGGTVSSDSQGQVENGQSSASESETADGQSSASESVAADGAGTQTQEDTEPAATGDVPTILTASKLSEALGYNIKNHPSEEYIKLIQKEVGAPVNGKWDEATCQYIAKWQQDVCQFKKPDGQFGPSSQKKVSLAVEDSGVVIEIDKAKKYCNDHGYKYSEELDDLNGTFRTKAKEVIEGVKKVDGLIEITQTIRHPVRAAFMHYARYKYAGVTSCVNNAVNFLKTEYGLGVTGNAKQAATALGSGANGFGIAKDDNGAYCPVGLHSNHCQGTAVDMNLKNMKAGSSIEIGGQSMTIQAGGSAAARLSNTLKKYSYTGFNWYGSADAVHWSESGR